MVSGAYIVLKILLLCNVQQKGERMNHNWFSPVPSGGATPDLDW